MLAIRWLIRHGMRHDELASLGHDRLRVEGLHEGSAADHDPALRIGEVSLCLGLRLAIWRCRDAMLGQFAGRPSACRGLAVVVVLRKELLRRLFTADSSRAGVAALDFIDTGVLKREIRRKRRAFTPEFKA